MNNETDALAVDPEPSSANEAVRHARAAPTAKHAAPPESATRALNSVTKPAAEAAAAPKSKAQTSDAKTTFRARLAATAIAALITLLAFEMLVRATPTEPPGEPIVRRAPNVVALSRHMEDIPPPVTTRPQLLLVGSSQVFGIGGKQRGDVTSIDGDGTTIDTLAAAIDMPGVEYYRLADQGFLPFESLVAVERLYQYGYAPKVVVLAWSWPFFARDQNVRPWVHALFRDRDLTARLESLLRDHHASAAVWETFQTQRTQAEREVAADERRSTADRADIAIRDWASRYVAMLSDNAGLRSRLYMAFVEHGGQLVTRGNLRSQPVVESDLALNLDVMRVLVEELGSHGVRTLAYLTPERSDYPVLTDDTRADEVFAKLAQQLAPSGLMMVDARRTVPSEEFGWFNEFPDRAHFSLKAHALLGAFLGDALKRNHLLDALAPR